MNALLCGTACMFSAYVLPPIEYDKPFLDGPLFVTRAITKGELRKLCNLSKPGLDLGCAWLKPTYCQIIMAPDQDIAAAGYVPSLVFRHERGHCNRWPDEHPGSRVPTAADWKAPLSKFYQE